MITFIPPDISIKYDSCVIIGQTGTSPDNPLKTFDHQKELHPLKMRLQNDSRVGCSKVPVGSHYENKAEAYIQSQTVQMHGPQGHRRGDNHRSGDTAYKLSHNNRNRWVLLTTASVQNIMFQSHRNTRGLGVTNRQCPDETWI